MIKKLSFLIISSVLALSVLTGCTNSNKNSDSVSTETIKVTDSKGEVEIPANPQRIVDLSGNSDILKILGYDVVGTANSDAYDYTKLPSYLEEELSDAKIVGYSMQDTMDIEGILNLNPDLIIISNVQEKMYEQLKDIAPTVMIQLEQIDWTEDLKSIAKIFGKEDIAEKWLNDYTKEASTAGEKIIEKNGKNTTYLPILASGGQIYVFDAAGIGSVMFDDMKLSKPSNLPEQDSISLPVVSYEGLAEIDADYLVLVGTDDDIASLKENSIYQNMRAVKNGNVIELPSSPYFNMGYSCIGKKKFLEESADIF